MFKSSLFVPRDDGRNEQLQSEDYSVSFSRKRQVYAYKSIS